MNDYAESKKPAAECRRPFLQSFKTNPEVKRRVRFNTESFSIPMSKSDDEANGKINTNLAKSYGVQKQRISRKIQKQV